MRIAIRITRRVSEMKEVKNLMINRIGEGTTYICSIDGTVLVEVHDDGTFESMSSCPHFEWWELTKACYYLGIGDISPEELKSLRKNAIMTLFEGMFVNVLVPARN